jgi:hypothetical protein
MAICLPGMPSSVKRAATSAMRVAPLVITTNWIITMMAKMITATISDPLATKLPNTSMTLPAANSPRDWALVRISRVVPMLSTRRKSVMANSNDGNDEKSSGDRMYITVTRITALRVILAARKKSMIDVGSGVRITRINASANAGKINPRIPITRLASCGTSNRPAEALKAPALAIANSLIHTTRKPAPSRRHATEIRLGKFTQPSRNKPIP